MKPMDNISIDEKKVYAACIGLARVCASNPKTEKTDEILFYALHHPKENVLESLHAEKNRISPGCVSCQSHCGNTDDAFPEMDSNGIKQKVFDLCLKTTKIDLIYEGLARISYPAADDFYSDIFMRLQKSI